MMWKAFSVGAAVAAAVAMVACASSGAKVGTEERAAAPKTFEQQVALGAAAYTDKCASCHGASGEGGGGTPRVVGLAQGALPLDPPADRKERTMRFETVADVAGFVVKTMPPDAPGSLDAETYWAILAFDLHANGIDLKTKLTPELAATLEIPR